MRSKVIALTLGAAAAITLLHTPAPAEAYNLNTPRAGVSTTLYLNPWVQIILPDHYTAFQNAAAKLNANPSNMRFTLANDDDVVFAGNNGESEVTFTADTTLLCGSLACTWNYTSGGVLVESDVYFDSGYAWVTTDLKADNTAYGASGSKRPLLNTAIHEFGHALGMGHEDDVFNIMGNAWNVVNTNGASTETVISEDTSHGLVAHYGERADVKQDLSLYHWRWISNAGGYSNHTRTSVTSGSGNPLPPAPALDPTLNEPAYYVSSGQQLIVEQTAENRGTYQSVTIKWYLSTDADIETTDTLLATSTINKGRGTPYTWGRELNLPTGLTAGDRYWIGAIIDSENVLTEQNEINNAVYVAELVVQ